MINIFERNRFVISITLSLVILTMVTITLSSFSPTKKSDEYFELENTLKSIDSYNAEINNWESAKNVLIDLNYWFDLLPRYDEVGMTDSDVLSLQYRMKEKIARLQLAVLPSIRKYFGDYLFEKFQLDNYKVVVMQDERNKIIVFTHDSFTNRKSLEKFHSSVVTELKILGFKQIRYKWYELEKSEDEKYIHYNFKDFSDNEIRRYNLSMLDS